MRCPVGALGQEFDAEREVVGGGHGGRGVGHVNPFYGEVRADEDVIDAYEWLHGRESGAGFVVRGGFLHIAQTFLDLLAGERSRAGIEVAAEDDGFIVGDGTQPVAAEQDFGLLSPLLPAQSKVGVDNVHRPAPFHFQ